MTQIFVWLIPFYLMGSSLLPSVSHATTRRLNFLILAMGRGQRLAAPMQPANIATVSGYGAYANMGGVGNSPQVLIPQAANGLAQYGNKTKLQL